MKPTDEHLTDEDVFGVPGYDEDPEGREEKLTEKQLRCKDCRAFYQLFADPKRGYWCWQKGHINPGQFACKRFVYKRE